MFDINEINEKILNLKKNCKIQLKNISNTVNDIIKYNIKDINIIERTLDDLLDLVYVLGNEVESVYYKLLLYYKNINLEFADEYEKFYLEIITEEENYTLKKKKL